MRRELAGLRERNALLAAVAEDIRAGGAVAALLRL
jgi:hypothetical protein